MKKIFVLKEKRNPAFTLIEVVIYLALFSIVIGSAVSAVYYLLEENASTRARMILQEEGNFILAKINWALNYSEKEVKIETPSVGQNSSNLIVKKANNNEIVARATFNDGKILFDSGGGNFFELNSERVRVVSLSFFQPQKGELKVDLILSTLSDQGKNFSRNFEMTKILKK